jgi:hypothetical protein
MEYYAVIKQREFDSKYGGRATEIILVNIKTKTEYKTYIDKRNFNAVNWSHILRHPERGYILSGVKIKDREKCIINADSDPVISFESSTQDAVFDELTSYWSEQDHHLG